MAKTILSFSISFWSSFSAKAFLIAPPEIIIGFFAFDISLIIFFNLFIFGFLGSEGNFVCFLSTQISFSETSAVWTSKGKAKWQDPGLPVVLSLKAFLISFAKFLDLLKTQFHLVSGLNNAFWSNSVSGKCPYDVVGTSEVKEIREIEDSFASTTPGII